LDKRLKKIRVAFYAFTRLYLTLLDFIDPKSFRKLILQNRESVIDLVDNLPVGFNRSLVCKFLRISEHQFKIWRNNRRFKCPSSLIGYCTKRFPTQISQKEINVLKSFMSRRRFSTWSIGSIWGFAFKKGFISMSRTSWYRYCVSLDISKEKKQPKVKRKRGSVMAKRPNEIWHMDITEVITSDFVKFYIHTVVDNFSRKVLAYTVSRDKTAKTRLISLRNAVMNVFDFSVSDHELDLIVDGGSENNNARVHNFMRHCHVNINKKIALKHVRFSNSVIEGHFKMLKSFLRKYGEVHSTDIHNVIAFFVKEHNQNKPFYLFQFHTPNEIHDNPDLIDVKPTTDKVNQQRLNYNRNHCCKLKP